MAARKQRTTKSKPRKAKRRTRGVAPKRIKTPRARLKAKGAAKAKLSKAKPALPKAPPSPLAKSAPGARRRPSRRLGLAQPRPAQGRSPKAPRSVNAYEMDLDRRPSLFGLAFRRKDDTMNARAQLRTEY